MNVETLLDGRVTLHHGDSRDVLRAIPDASIDSVVTDPPYALVSIGKRFGRAGAAPAKHGSDGLYARATAGFMGQSWDTGETAFAVEFWAEVLRVLKPGGHVVAFSGTRTYHRLAVAIEDAGFEIRDQLAWMYGTGFPKSHDVSKGIDRALGFERSKVRHPARPASSGTMAGSSDTRPWIVKSRESGFHEAASDEAASDEAAEWSGWGTALKPAWEPMVLARKPIVGTVAANVLAHGTGAINIDGCRVGSAMRSRSTCEKISENSSMSGGNYSRVFDGFVEGRWPANIAHDGSDEVVGTFPASGAETAARFFFSAKADAHDRIGSKHPTVKPVDLMQWLCRLVTPPGGIVLDPFSGSGSTGEAAWREGFRAILIEREASYCDDIRRRMRLVDRPGERAAVAKARGEIAADHGPLFGGPATPPVDCEGMAAGSTATLPTSAGAQIGTRAR